MSLGSMVINEFNGALALAYVRFFDRRCDFLSKGKDGSFVLVERKSWFDVYEGCVERGMRPEVLKLLLEKVQPGEYRPIEGFGIETFLACIWMTEVPKAPRV